MFADLNDRLIKFNQDLQFVSDSLFNKRPHHVYSYSIITNAFNLFLRNNRANIIDDPSCAFSLNQFADKISELLLFSEDTNDNNSAQTILTTIRKITDFIDSLH